MNKVHLSLQPVIRQHVQKQIHFTLQRYEKSLDPELTLTALLRYVYLVKQMDKGAKISSVSGSALSPSVQVFPLQVTRPAAIISSA